MQIRSEKYLNITQTIFYKRVFVLNKQTVDKIKKITANHRSRNCIHENCNRLELPFKSSTRLNRIFVFCLTGNASENSSLNFDYSCLNWVPIQNVNFFQLKCLLDFNFLLQIFFQTDSETQFRMH